MSCGGDGAENGMSHQDRRWAALVAQLLHPIDVQKFEAFAWIDKHLSERDLFNVFGGKVFVPTVHFRVRRLSKLRAIEVRGARAALVSSDSPYRLAGPPDQEPDGS